MKLDRDYSELTELEVNMKAMLFEIYNDYFNNKRKFPYNMIDYLIGRYDFLYDKFIKSKGTLFNVLLSNISSNYKEKLDKLKISTSFEIMNDVCVSYLDYIKENSLMFIPLCEEDIDKVYGKLYPVIMYLNIEDIVYLYDNFKMKIINSDSDNKDELLFLLQKLYVSFVYIVLYSRPMECYKYKYNGNDLSYNDICLLIFKEDSLSDVQLKKVLKKRYP